MNAQCFSTEYYASQFPQAVKRSGKKNLTGDVVRITRRGLYVVQWDHRLSPDTLHPKFIQFTQPEDSPGLPDKQS